MDDDRWTLLLARLAGTATPDQEAELQGWLDADPSRVELMDSLERLVAMTGDLPPRHDVDAAWRRMQARRRAAGPESRPSIPFRSPIRRAAEASPARRGSSRIAFARAAAVVALVAASALVWQATGRRVAAPEITEIATGKGQRSTVTLADGSRVELGPESRLRAPMRFGRDSRPVEVQGLAYFDVNHDPRRPFQVQAAGARIHVLGTEFSVRAYPDEGEVSVAVAEGSVSLGSSHDVTDSTVVLSKGELGVLRHGAPPAAVRDPEIGAHLGWRSGRLTFNNDRLTDIADELGRWYDVEFLIATPELAERRLSISVQNEPLEQVLELLSISLDLRHDREGRTIVLSASRVAR